MERKGNEAGVDEEFEPFCKWQRKEDSDVLDIHLPEFKKEQLRVQLSNLGVLKISGERQLVSSRKSKFYKELPLSSNYDTNAILAKFINGWLQITLPKRKISSVTQADEKKPAEPSKTDDQTPKPDATKDQAKAAPISGGAKEQIPKPDATKDQAKAAPISDGAKEQKVAPPGGAPTECQFRVKKRTKSGPRLAKVAVSLAATVALIAILVACGFYMHRSIFGEIEVENL